MSNTPEEIKKLIIQARSFTPVKLNDISAGNSVNVSLGYGSVRAQALTNVNGNGIAFQTDQGNWYVIGESANDNISNGENRRQIIYRVVRPNPVNKYPVKTIYATQNRNTFALIDFYLGGDRSSIKLQNRIPDEAVFGQVRITNYGKKKFNIYGIFLYGLLSDTLAGNAFVIVNDKIIKQTDNTRPNYSYLIHEYSGNKVLLSLTEESAIQNRQGVIKSEIKDYTYSRMGSRPVVVYDTDNPENNPYGWSYFGDPNYSFRDEYEYDMEITSYFEEESTTLNLVSSHSIEETIVTLASNPTAIRGDDDIWRTGFFTGIGGNNTRKIIVNKEATFTISGNSTVIYTNDGYINQDYEASITFIEGYTERYLTSNDRYYWALDDAYFVPQETKNIISLHYGETNIVLNTDDFFCTRLNYYFYEKPEVGGTFEFLFHNIGGKQASGVSLNLALFGNNNYLANVYYYDEENEKDVYFLIKGQLLGAVPTADPDIYSINCNITYVKQELTSFADHLILDNGSFYNFLLRNSYGSELPKVNINDRDYQSAYFQGQFLIYSSGWYTPYTEGTTKTNVPFLFLDQNFCNLLLSTYYTKRDGRWVNKLPFTDYLEQFFGNLGTGLFDVIGRTGLKNTNIIKNKIYCVVKTDKNKAWVEQWDIKENGDVKYNKVFQVDYVPLKKPKEENNERLAIFAHSYYPT